MKSKMERRDDLLGRGLLQRKIRQSAKGALMWKVIEQLLEMFEVAVALNLGRYIEQAEEPSRPAFDKLFGTNALGPSRERIFRSARFELWE